MRNGLDHSGIQFKSLVLISFKKFGLAQFFSFTKTKNATTSRYLIISQYEAKIVMERKANTAALFPILSSLQERIQ